MLGYMAIASHSVPVYAQAFTTCTNYIYPQ